MGAICSLILLFRGKVWCPQPAAGTQIKNGTRIAQTLHGLVFHGSIFDNISSVIFGFCFGFSRICKCCSTCKSWLFVLRFVLLLALSHCGNQRSVFITQWARSWWNLCPSGATCLPMLGNVLTHVGHAACPKMYCFRPKRYGFTT